ncbi:hypothetical protein COT72_03170 [archaeon CG10_big_fil_rev_8_21_14_0_10_43_11]|nr:MAG: hypothetical protein COT72_03170 [archaeon CG10_big_fil_rev_8_21_14_0_10_43_11]
MNSLLNHLLRIENRVDTVTPTLQSITNDIGDNSLPEISKQLQKIVFQDYKFAYSKKSHNFFSFIDTRLGHCVDFSLLYYFIFDTLEKESSIIAAPFHALVHATDKADNYYIESTDGKLANLDFYISTRNIPVKSIENEIYLSDLRDNDVIAIYLNRKSELSIMQEDFESANTILKKALIYSQRVPEVYYNLGCVSKKLDAIDEAAQYFTSAIKLHSNFSQAFNNLGTCYIQSGNRKKAKSCFKRAIELDHSKEAEHNLLQLLNS